MNEIKDMSRHPLRMCYFHMMHRCYNHTDKAYRFYGGRGIQVDLIWHNRDNFYQWALPLWRHGLQLDRRDNNGNYSPENCRFITAKENIRNSRHFIKQSQRDLIKAYYQDKMNIAQIARELNVSRPAIYAILKEA